MKNKKYSIRVRLMLFIAAAILPLNLIVIGFAGELIHSYQRTVRENCQRNIDHYCEELDEFEQAVEHDVEAMIEARHKEMDEMELYHYRNRGNFHFMNNLEEIWRRYPLAEMAYVVYGDGMVTVISDPEETEESRRKAARDYLGMCSAEAERTGITSVRIQEEPYFMLHYTSRNFCFGFLAPMEAIFQEMRRYSVGGADSFRIAAAKEACIPQGDEEVIWSECFHGSYRLEWHISSRELEESIFFIKMLLSGVALVTLIVFPVTWRAISREIVKPLSEIQRAMKEVEQDNYGYRMDEAYRIWEFWEIHRAFNKMAGEIVHLKIESYERELEKRDIEATNLRLQVNPHFLMNSLNMIYSFCRSKNIAAIRPFTGYLAKYFQYALWNTEGMVALEKEMECVESYLEIQKIRFPGKFYGVYQMEEDLAKEQIPSFLIINFVENAIKYGLDMNRSIEIIVSVHTEQEKLFITITDTGNGIPAKRLETINSGGILEDDRGRHIGIWNCRRRIHMLYGEAAKLSITSRLQQGTQVSIELPRESHDEGTDCRR